MLAAIQKCPSGLSGAIATAARPAAMPRLECRLPVLLGRVSAQPIPRARELPGRLEVLRVARQARGPDCLGGLCARELLPLRVEGIRVLRLRGGWGGSREDGGRWNRRRA